jgi:hypothetical protein
MPVSTKRLLVARIVPSITRVRFPRLFDDVRAFVLFVGHGRSGSTLVGSLLNAHPNVVLTNELDALDYVDRGLSREQLLNLIHRIDKRLVRKGSTGGGGYTYAVPNQWQGRHREILVMGDRKAGATATHVLQRPHGLELLRNLFGEHVRFVTVVRNPYDNIVTMFEKTKREPGEGAESHLRRQIDGYFLRCDAVETVARRFGDECVHRAHHEDVVERTQEAIESLCGFLGIETKDDYVRDCAGIVEPAPRRTRHRFEWSRDLIDIVAERMEHFPWLSRYSFDEGAGSG